MILFYAPGIVNEDYSLSSAESKHCLKVLRHKEGDFINILDGRGGYYKANIISVSNGICSFRLEDSDVQEPSKIKRHIAIAPVKNMARIEWFIEKATEIGVDKISFLSCEHSVKKNVKMERIQKIAISSMKQSLNRWLPEIYPPVAFNTFIQESNQEGKFIAHKSQKSSLLLNVIGSQKDICIMIGPEGGFSDTEIKTAADYGFQLVSLGVSRMRTETAGVVACSIINQIAQ